MLCTVSVFSESQELNRVLGESVKFPAAVKIDGSLRYRSVTIGDMTGGRFRTLDKKYEDRLQWDSSTGLFSLSELKEEDSGVYTVQDTNQNINTIFQLNVYKDNVPVSKPNVGIIHNEYPCTIECTAERGTGVTLSWYREGEKKPYVSSHVASAPHLHLPQTVERSGTYTCEAKNSVSNEKASITVGAHCTAGFSAGTIAAIIIAVVAVAIAVVCAVLYWPLRGAILEGQAALQDALRGAILEGHPLVRDEGHPLIRDAITKVIRDNQALLQDEGQALIRDAVRRVIRDKYDQGLLQDGSDMSDRARK